MSEVKRQFQTLEAVKNIRYGRYTKEPADELNIQQSRERGKVAGYKQKKGSTLRQHSILEISSYPWRFSVDHSGSFRTKTIDRLSANFAV
jgi:hypothetical protein